MRELVLVTGGVRSGKSRKALEIAADAPRTFVATAAALDGEMAARIAEHRRSRASDFATVEEPVELARALRERPDGDLVADCMTLWLSNLMEAGAGREEIGARVRDVIDAAKGRRGRTVLVTNEVGWGVVPVSELGRRFRDESGSMSQALAAAADRVLLVVAGLELRLK